MVVLITIRASNDDVVSSLCKCHIVGISRVLIRIINKPGKEPEGHSFPDPAFTVSIGRFVLRPELAGNCLFKEWFCDGIIESSDFPAIQM